VKRWCIPPAQNAAFAAAMEDILSVYTAPPDPARPLVCFDEGGKQLQGHRRPPQPAAPGQPEREDYTYVRNGAANLFLACAPHLGWRQVWSTPQRTATDFAQAIRWLIDAAFPDAERIVLVTDNLNTHTPAAFYQSFAPAEARRLVAKLEWHYTPKHGSWLNMAELELAVLSRQCLARRIPDRAALEREVQAWSAQRNQAGVTLRWSFTIDDARARLENVYPVPVHDNYP
jgi:DDE superfamily endonuclease